MQPTAVSFFALFVFCCGNALAQTAPKLLPFQGRLTDQNGVAVSNGVRLVQFKIFTVPTGDSPVWAGELHRTTVNGGLVNVMLGTKTPLTGVDFDRQLYLEITVDVSGPGGTNDNAITLADPPMLPRQAILPVVFAKETADSRKLAGFDWSALFGVNDPVSGKLPGERIANKSIGFLQIADNAISNNAIVVGAVTSEKIAAGAVGTAQLDMGSVTQEKLAAKDLKRSVSVTDSTDADTESDVGGLSITITTTGRPVLLMLEPGDLQNSSIGEISFEVNGVNDGQLATPVELFGFVSFYRGSNPVGKGFRCNYPAWSNFSTSALRLPPTSFQLVDTPVAGSHTYKVRWSSFNRVAQGQHQPSLGKFKFTNVRLLAFEL